MHGLIEFADIFDKVDEIGLSIYINIINFIFLNLILFLKQNNFRSNIIDYNYKNIIISKESLDLLQKILKVDPEKRIN